MRITCVIGTLGGGGAERVMTYLCGGLAARGHEVTLLTLDESVPDFYSVPENVKRVRVSLPTFKNAGFWGGFPRLWKLTRSVQRTRPEVLISFMTISVLASSYSRYLCRPFGYPPFSLFPQMENLAQLVIGAREKSNRSFGAGPQIHFSLSPFLETGSYLQPGPAFRRRILPAACLHAGK